MSRNQEVKMIRIFSILLLIIVAYKTNPIYHERFNFSKDSIITISRDEYQLKETYNDYKKFIGEKDYNSSTTRR